MAANEYHFVTHWRIEGTVQEVSDVLADAKDLPRWWPSVYLEVQELHPGDERGVGREISLYTKGWLPYTLRWSFRVVESRYPFGFGIEAQGDFVGRGVWTLAQDGPWVDVTYDWRIRADKPLLRRLSLLMKPIFEANHRWAMARGEESLRLELARRHATPEERPYLPPPPAPTTTSPLPLLLGAAGAAAAVAMLALVARRLLRHRQSRPGTGRQSRPGTGRQSRPGTGRRARRWRFDPDRVAHFEAAGWRAYYDRDWGKLLRLLVRMCQEQFRIPFPQSLAGAYYVTRAAAAWAPANHNVERVRHFYERFYRLARRYSGMAFDPARVADLEVAYNDVHRRLSGLPDKGEYVRAMTQLHAALFGLPPALARESAELRVLASNIVDEITGKRSVDVEGDWKLLEEYLRGCYRSVRRALDLVRA